MNEDEITVPTYIARRYKDWETLIEAVNKRVDEDITKIDFLYEGSMEKVEFLIASFYHARAWRARDPEEFRKAVEELLEHALREIVNFGWSGREKLGEKLRRLCQEQPYHHANLRGWEECDDLAEAMTYVLSPPRGRRPKTEEEYPVEEIRKMKDEGLSIRQIAAKTGISKSTIHRLLSRPEK